MSMDTTRPTAQLFEALGLNELPGKEQEELMLDIEELVFKGSMLRLLEDMDERTKREFTELLDSEPSEAELEAFLAERVPDADQAVTDTIQELQDDILAVTGESQD